VAWRGFSFYVKWHQKNDTYSSFSIFENFLFICLYFLFVFFFEKIKATQKLASA